MVTTNINKNECIVRIKSADARHCIGSGVLYTEENLGDRVYLLTAAHCLFEDADTFNVLRNGIVVDVFSTVNKKYEEVVVLDLCHNAVMLTEKTNDLAVVVLEKHIIDSLCPNLPVVKIVTTNADVNEIIALGFPKANNHQEVFTARTTWLNERVGTKQFVLQCETDLIEDYAGGFSGGGLFLQVNREILLMGIFARFLMEERGRQIYGQSFVDLNSLLVSKNLPEITFGYIGDGGLTEALVNSNVCQSIANLGPNFNPDLNLRTNIHKYMDAVIRNKRYRRELFRALDGWLNDLKFYGNENNSAVGQLEASYDFLKVEIAKLLREKDLNVSKKYDFSDIDVLVDGYKQSIRELIEAKHLVLHSLKSEERKHDRETEESYLSRLYRLENHCLQYQYIKERVLVNITNTPIAFVEGEAGCGKSHLLGDLASSIISQGNPLFLLLGREFNHTVSIEQNIINQLHLSCSFEDLLINMNRIGTERDNRFMILIDAINETNGKYYWRDRIAGFIEKVKAFPAIGVVMTIRTSYLSDCLPKQIYLNRKGDVNVLKHVGLKGRELEAIPLFCEYYQITAPSLPILNPEYSNPLLLTISCQVAQKTSEKKFIMANYGVSGLFERYRQQMDEKFNDKHNGLYDSLRVVTKAIKTIVAYMYEHSLYRLEYEECHKLLSEAVGQYPLLLNDLIAECLLIKEKGYGDQESTSVRFSYQRLSDYYMADCLLESNDKQGVISMFQDESFIKVLANNANHSGLVEQLAVLLPERYGIELFEIYDVDNTHMYPNGDSILMDSLKWRNPKNVNPDKIIPYLESKEIDYYEWLNTCMLLAPISEHPFNSDFFSKLMKCHKLAQRESILQPYILNYYITDENYSDQYIKNLLNWCWTNNVSEKVDRETARLAGQQLAWLLCSTINSLRDKATKALVNLLQDQTDALIDILKAFEGVDDIYIQERLYAVAYGCVLRSKNLADVQKIGSYVYEMIFKGGNPPRHILWRDYACNTVDYAVKVAGLSDINMDLVLPPYNSVVPTLPTQEEIEKKYKLSYDDKSISYAHEQNNILNSLIDGLADFGTKILDSRVRDFKGWSFKLDEEYVKFKKSFRGKKREMINAYETIYFRYLQKQENGGGINYASKENDIREKIESMLIDQLPVFYNYLEETIGKEAAKKLKDEYIPNQKKKLIPDYRNEINPWPIRCWVVQRVFDLGYDRNIHGEYDKKAKQLEGYSRHKDLYEGKVERIGKKYEWIGLYEILGCLADNHEIESPWDTYRSKRYEGAWVHFIRDIDPVRITRFHEDDDESIQTWHDYDSYSHWNLDGKTWLQTKADMVDIKNYLQRNDKQGRQWLTIHDYRMCKEPKQLGDDKWNCNRYHNIRINAFIIKASDKQKLIAKSENVNFYETSYLEPYDSHTYHIAREKFWSRGYEEEASYHKNKWEVLFTGSSVKAKLICEQYAGDMEDDYSGTRGQCYMPTQEVMNLLGLKYGNSDGEFINSDNKTIGICNPNRPIHLLLSKDELIKALRQNGLDIVWILSMERMYSAGNNWSNSTITYPNGLFYLDDDCNIQGKITIHERKWR